MRSVKKWCSPIQTMTDALGRNALSATAARPADCWLTLDREWVITSCGDGVPGVLAQSIGMTVWDAFPDSREKFIGIYEAGWRNGQSSGTVYYNSAFSTIECVKRQDHLLVSFQFVPIPGLLDAIAEAQRDLSSQSQHDQGPVLRLVRQAGA